MGAAPTAEVDLTICSKLTSRTCRYPEVNNTNLRIGIMKAKLDIDGQCNFAAKERGLLHVYRK